MGVGPEPLPASMPAAPRCRRPVREHDPLSIIESSTRRARSDHPDSVDSVAASPTLRAGWCACMCGVSVFFFDRLLDCHFQ